MLKKLMWAVFLIVLLLLLMPLLGRFILGPILALAAVLVAVKVYCALTRSDDDEPA